MKEQELLDLKKELEVSKEKTSELRGEKNALIKQLKKLGCSTIKKTKLRIKNLNSSIEELNKEIEQESSKLEELFKE